MMKLKTLITAAAFAMLAAFVGQANANTISVFDHEFHIDGWITEADSTNPFGLYPGDMVYMWAYWNGAPDGTIDFGDGTGNELMLMIGSVDYREFNDVDFFGGEFPTLTLSGGRLTGTDIVFEPGSNGVVHEFGSSGLTFGGDGITGEWHPVPAPAALALFGIGLMGFGLARRRRKVA